MMFNEKIPNALRKKIDRELEPRELIKWIEQPIPRFFTLELILNLLLSIPWTAFAIFWTYAAAGYKIPDFRKGIKPEYAFALFGLVFILFGFWSFSSPIRKWLRAFQTVYLITNKRAISIEKGWFITIKSYAPNQLKNVYRREKRDGTGDVIITTRTLRDSRGILKTEDIGFMNVRNPKEIETLLKQLAQTEE